MNTRGARLLNRITPKGATQHYKTYQIASPLTTHYRKATCAEVQCEHYTHGWRLRFDILQPQDLQAIKDSRRKYTVEDDGTGTQWLCFEAGQSCFKAGSHRISIERPEIYRVGRGDWRSYRTRDAYTHSNPNDWLDDFANHQDRIMKTHRRG